NSSPARRLSPNPNRALPNPVAAKPKTKNRTNSYSDLETTMTHDDPTSAAVFPVELRDVHVAMPKQLKKVPRFHAVVDVDRSHVFAVVGNDYKLVTNEEAISLGRTCFEQIFELTDVNKMI